MPYLPEEVHSVLKEHFFFPEKNLFGSVATVQNTFPRIRTMRIYDIDKKGCPVLLTHVASNKWQEFIHNPCVAISMVSETKLVQILVQGKLQLDTPLSSQDKAKSYWVLVRPDVKKIYDPAHAVGVFFDTLNDLSIPNDPPETFGIACVIPEFWEILHLDPEYTHSSRCQLLLKQGAWKKQRIHVG